MRNPSRGFRHSNRTTTNSETDWEATHSGNSRVTAITTGAVPSGPFTNSIGSIFSFSLRLDRQVAHLLAAEANANFDPGTSTRRM